MSFFLHELEPEDQGLYQRVTDILGHAGQDALERLCEAVWESGYDSGYDNGYDAGKEAARGATEGS